MSKLTDALFIGILALELGFITFQICVNTPRVKPHILHTNPEFKPYIDEYKALAATRGIYFKKNVNVGFTDVDDGNMVGLTSYGVGFREIEIKRDYWRNADDMGRRAVIFHEFDHAFCTRGHTYGNNKEYSEAYMMELLAAIGIHKTRTAANGYLPDGCPMSLMHPILPSRYCLYEHISEYYLELFNNCEPY